jgi:hypothetical protein
MVSCKNSKEDVARMVNWVVLVCNGCGRKRVCKPCEARQRKTSYCLACSVRIFKRKERARVVCPNCSKERFYPPSTAVRLKTSYCKDCYAGACLKKTEEQKRTKLIVCPRCGAERRYIPRTTRRRKTDYCASCYPRAFRSVERRLLRCGCGSKKWFREKHIRKRKEGWVWRCYLCRTGVESLIDLTPEEFFQRMDSMRINAKTFFSTFSKALSLGEEGLDSAIQHYLWARKHNRELHAVRKSYRQEDTISEIMRVWSIDPERYVRTAHKLGGGTSSKQFAAGCALLKRIGALEAFRGTEKIGITQAVKVIKKLGTKITSTKYRVEVDKVYEKEIESLKKASGGNGTKSGAKKVDLREENNRLKTRILVLEQQVKTLRAELRWFKANTKVTAKAR